MEALEDEDHRKGGVIATMERMQQDIMAESQHARSQVGAPNVPGNRTGACGPQRSLVGGADAVDPRPPGWGRQKGARPAVAPVHGFR